MSRKYKSGDGRFEVEVQPVVVASDGPGPGAACLDPQWADLPDDLLVHLAGLSGQDLAVGGWTLPHPFGFKAQAELSRRLTAELAGFRVDAAASSATAEKLSTQVVVLTRRLLLLTWALLVAATATIVVAVAV